MVWFDLVNVEMYCNKANALRKSSLSGFYSVYQSGVVQYHFAKDSHWGTFPLFFLLLFISLLLRFFFYFSHLSPFLFFTSSSLFHTSALKFVLHMICTKSQPDQNYNKHSLNLRNIVMYWCICCFSVIQRLPWNDTQAHTLHTNTFLALLLRHYSLTPLPPASTEATFLEASTFPSTRLLVRKMRWCSVPLQEASRAIEGVSLWSSATTWRVLLWWESSHPHICVQHLSMRSIFTWRKYELTQKHNVSRAEITIDFSGYSIQFYLYSAKSQQTVTSRHLIL